jgi:hypothetical protein
MSHKSNPVSLLPHLVFVTYLTTLSIALIDLALSE